MCQLSSFFFFWKKHKLLRIFTIWNNAWLKARSDTKFISLALFWGKKVKIVLAHVCFSSARPMILMYLLFKNLCNNMALSAFLSWKQQPLHAEDDRVTCLHQLTWCSPEWQEVIAKYLLSTWYTRKVSWELCTPFFPYLNRWQPSKDLKFKPLKSLYCCLMDPRGCRLPLSSQGQSHSFLWPTCRCPSAP